MLNVFVTYYKFEFIWVFENNIQTINKIRLYCIYIVLIKKDITS